MAMFEKLFVKRDLDDISVVSIKRDSRSYELVPEQVRLLLFKECDWRGRKVLFDSATVEKVPTKKDDKPNVGLGSQLPCILEVSDGFTYLYKGPAVDAGILGEMIFGAVAMNVKNVSLKIHIMDDPKRLMCSKVFCVPAGRPITKKVSEPCAGDVRRNTTKSFGMPLKEEGLALSFSLDRGDSGFYGEHSPQSSVGSTYDYFNICDNWEGYVMPDDSFTFHCPLDRRLSTTSSTGSWQRRTSMNMATKFEFAGEGNLLTVPRVATNVTSSDSQVYSNSSASGTSDSLSSATSSGVIRKRKFGLALIITVSDNAKMDVVKKCIERSTQLQALISRVRSAARAASVAGLYHASVKARAWLSDLLFGPRIQPMWLSLVTSDVRNCNKMADKLLADICSVLAVGDTKITNFFISTLLTHILTYHLGWVTTVSPYDTVELSERFVEGPEKRPYNALWAQLTDLCGSIGFPPRAARTIISGTTNANFMNCLLKVLTYFLRCGNVKKLEFKYQDCVIKETKVTSVNKPTISGLRKTETKRNLSVETLNVKVNSQCSVNSVKTVVSCETGIKKSTTLGNLSVKLSSNAMISEEHDLSMTRIHSGMRRNPTTMQTLSESSDSLMTSIEQQAAEQNVVFVLGDDDKLVGLKNKSNSGKSVKKSSKVKMETEDTQDKINESIQDTPKTNSPSKCCSQTRQHSKSIKHSGFKFEFDKYPQIVTNYMKSKNLEILDRHYLGKPGNLKLDNYQFDPTVVPPIQEESCETCYKCQMMEATLQTPTNASEMEYMNDIPRQSEPQFAKETIVDDDRAIREISPKTFVRKRKANTVVVNVPEILKEKIKDPVPKKCVDENKTNVSENSMLVNLEKDSLYSSIPEIRQPDSNSNEPIISRLELRRAERDRKEAILFEVKRVIEFPLPDVSAVKRNEPNDFEMSLFGGVTDHYVPDLILQGTTAKPSIWEMDLRRDLELTTNVSRSLSCPVQAVAIVGDINNWQVAVLGKSSSGVAGAAPIVCNLLDALQAMKRARVPANQCISFIESKLREFCVLSKTLADMLMSTDFCDITTLTKSLNIDINDVPLLLAVATTHTPQVATRYGISYR